MTARVPILVAVTLAVVLGGPRLTAADEKVREATVVTAGDGKLTLIFVGGPRESTHGVARGADITLDGQVADLGDLKEAFVIRVTVGADSAITRIRARAEAPGEYVLTVEGMT